MKTHLLCSIVALAVLGGAVNALGKTPPSNKQVDREVEDITREPRYRWLREGVQTHETPAGEGRRKTTTHRARRFDDNSGCDFDPQIDDSPDSRETPEGDGCGSSSPGSFSDSMSSDGCGCQPSMGDCGCSPTIGDCGCAPAIGNCGGCGSIGAFGPTMGYLFAALALGGVIFVVVRELLNRDKGPADASLVSLADMESPEEVRVSQINDAPPDALVERAREAARTGDFRRAVGWLYLGGIAMLGQGGLVELDRSTTNRVIVESTRKRGGPHGPAQALVGHFEDVFFGDRPGNPERYEECLRIVSVDFAPIRKEEPHGD